MHDIKLSFSDFKDHVLYEIDNLLIDNNSNVQVYGLSKPQQNCI